VYKNNINRLVDFNSLVNPGIGTLDRDFWVICGDGVPGDDPGTPI